MYFLLTFLLTISPRKSTQSVHQIAQFQSQKCKSSFVWEGGPRPSPPDPPPARALRALACVFPTILQILPPTDREISCSCPPPPPDNRHLLRPGRGCFIVFMWFYQKLFGFDTHPDDINVKLYHKNRSKPNNF